MTLDRETVLAGIPAELERFHRLISDLTAENLTTATRCTDWTVRDVAGHVIGTLVDVSEGRVEAQGTPAVTQRQAAERSGHSPRELADELRRTLPRLMDALQSFPPELWNSPAPNDPTYELGFAVEALWYDAYLHADDIRVALGLTPHHGDGLRCAVHHIAGYLDHQSWRPATLELTGIEPIHISGGGPAITGDPRLFVLCATGRGDPNALGLDASVNVYAKQPDRSPTGPAQRPR